MEGLYVAGASPTLCLRQEPIVFSERKEGSSTLLERAKNHSPILDTRSGGESSPRFVWKEARTMPLLLWNQAGILPPQLGSINR